jgi:hypothetical protein
MFGIMLISVGTLLAISGLAAASRYRANALLVRGLLRIRSQPVAEARDGQPVRIDGRIAASTTETLVAPCSGDASVWFRVRLRRDLGVQGGGADGGGGAVWATIVDEEESTPFHVDDGSGQRAQVATTKFRTITRARAFDKLDDDASARLRGFLTRRGHEPISADVYEEECLHPGENVVVVGLSRRSAGEVRRELYRDAPSSELLLEADSGQELIVATPEMLRRARGGAYLASQTVMALGIVAIVVGIVVHKMIPE